MRPSLWEEFNGGGSVTPPPAIPARPFPVIPAPARGYPALPGIPTPVVPPIVTNGGMTVMPSPAIPTPVTDDTPITPPEKPIYFHTQPLDMTQARVIELPPDYYDQYKPFGVPRPSGIPGTDVLYTFDEKTGQLTATFQGAQRVHPPGYPVLTSEEELRLSQMGLELKDIVRFETGKSPAQINLDNFYKELGVTAFQFHTNMAAGKYSPDVMDKYLELERITRSPAGAVPIIGYTLTPLGKELKESGYSWSPEVGRELEKLEPRTTTPAIPTPPRRRAISPALVTPTLRTKPRTDIITPISIDEPLKNDWWWLILPLLFL